MNYLHAGSAALAAAVPYLDKVTRLNFQQGKKLTNKQITSSAMITSLRNSICSPEMETIII